MGVFGRAGWAQKGAGIPRSSSTAKAGLRGSVLPESWWGRGCRQTGAQASLFPVPRLLMAAPSPIC